MREAGQGGRLYVVRRVIYRPSQSTVHASEPAFIENFVQYEQHMRTRTREMQERWEAGDVSSKTGSVWQADR
jgi:hypothetical protein